MVNKMLSLSRKIKSIRDKYDKMRLTLEKEMEAGINPVWEIVETKKTVIVSINRISNRKEIKEFRTNNFDGLVLTGQIKQELPKDYAMAVIVIDGQRYDIEITLNK